MILKELYLRNKKFNLDNFYLWLITSKMKFICYLTFIVIVTFTSCEGDLENQNVVLTEDVLFLSGQNIRVLGRIYSSTESNIANHGFEIDVDSSFSNPVLIDLGEKTGLGTFVGEYEGLNSNSDYFYRAFAAIGGETSYGEIKEFKTLTISIDSFDPAIAYSGETMQINGANFSSDIKVYFGTEEAEIIDIWRESIITLTIPNINDYHLSQIRIEDDEITVAFDDYFEYVYGTWNLIDYFPSDLKLKEPLTFASDDSFVVGSGSFTNASGFNNSFWVYNIDDESWSVLEFDGEVSLGAFSNDNGYFGGGIRDVNGFAFGSPLFSRQFWKLSNDEFTRLADLPLDLYNAISFSDLETVYVVGGLDSLEEQSNSIFRYSVLNNNWSFSLNVIPIDLTKELPHFWYNQLMYFITVDDQIWTYDPVSNIWNYISDAPQDIGYGGFSHVIGDKAYIGIFEGSGLIWEYDIINNEWKEKYQLTDYISYNNIGSYVKGSTIRLIKSDRLDPEPMKILEFDPFEY